MKLLHCLQSSQFLEVALRDGFQPKMHPVEFIVSQDNHPVYAEVFAMLKERLQALNTPYENLPPGWADILCRSVSNLTSKAPMICFTELTDGRDLHDHRFQFGSFGVVVDSSWVGRNGGDRVVYFGDNSEVSVRLYKALAQLRIRGIWVNSRGLPNPNTLDVDLMLGILGYFERRSHIGEQEWRIVGECQTPMDNIRISVADIETIYVPDDGWLAHFRQIADELAIQQGVRSVPEVAVFPANIPPLPRN